MIFKISEGSSGNGSKLTVSFNEETDRYSLVESDSLVLSDMSYLNCAARAAEKGVKLEPVPFGGWKALDGKDVSVTPKGGQWEVSVGGAEGQKVSEVGAAIRAAQAKTRPAPKKTMLAK
jgi:uncharacterized protein YfaP (DUF2135 family)